MGKFHIFVNSLLLVTSPSLLVYPQCENSIEQSAQEMPFNNINPTYDEILTLLQRIDEGKVEGCSEESIEEMRHFVISLAQHGVLPREYAANVELKNDIADLYSDEDIFSDYASYCDNAFDEYSILPTVLLQGEEGAAIFLCKHKHKGKCHHQSHHDHHKRKKSLVAKLKRFVKRHRKAIIIGAAVIVAATIVIVALAAAPTAVAAATGAAVGAATASDPKPDTHDPQDSPSSSGSSDVPPLLAAAFEAPMLKSAVDDHIISFKENLSQNQFFEKVIGQQNLSWEENGRALGSIFAHDAYKNLQNEIPYHPRLSQEIQDFHDKFGFSIPGGASMGHVEIDKQFTTDYSYLYSNPGQEADLLTLSHHLRGEKALSMGYCEQAIQDFGSAIECNPSNPTAYLRRGIAHFNAGQYEHSIEDYNQFSSYTQSQQPNSMSISEFTLGFAKGLPMGVYESGEGMLLFMADCVKHPIETSKQMINSIIALVDLVRKDEWGVVAEALSPQVHQLVTEWDTLSSEKKGELAGYAVGKHGADILAPGAIAKVASKSVKSAQELVAICKSLQLSQETLVLETAVSLGSSAKIAEIVENGQKMAFLGEELGLTTQEMGQLKQAGSLEEIIVKKYEHLNPSMQEIVTLYKKAEKALKPYAKKPMEEFKVRELIHETGIPTFPRPKGLPENFLVMISDRSAGMEYVHPTNNHIRVRVMPGKPHSPNPRQQKPYVVQMKDGKAFDSNGNLLLPQNLEVHIPFEEFFYRE